MSFYLETEFSSENALVGHYNCFSFPDNCDGDTQPNAVHLARTLFSTPTKHIIAIVLPISNKQGEDDSIFESIFPTSQEEIQLR